MLKRRTEESSMRGWGFKSVLGRFWRPRSRRIEGKEPLVRDESRLALEGSTSLGGSHTQPKPPPSERCEADLSDVEWNHMVHGVLEFLRNPGVDSLSVTELLVTCRHEAAAKRWHSTQWLSEFEQQVEACVQLKFPALPPEVTAEQQPSLHAFLRQVQEVVQGELLRLAPVFREVGLLGIVIDRYHTHTVSQLELLLQKNLNANQMFYLLEWTLHTYLSVSNLGDAELAADVQVSRDMLLLVPWLQKAKEQLLSVAQGFVAGCLQRIFEMEDAQSWEYSDEDFVRLAVDITQCVRGVCQKAKKVSPSLPKEMKKMCLFELHTALHRYIALERKRMRVGLSAKKLVILHLFRTVNTCQKLRLLVDELASETQTDAAAVGLLLELQAQATKQLVDTVTENAGVFLDRYFRGESAHLQQLLTEMKSFLKNLPKECHTHKVIMDTLYSRIVTLYVERLLLSDRRCLEKRWGEVGGTIREDAEQLQEVFSQQNEDVEMKNQLLLKVADVVGHEDIDALKITCLQLSTDFPNVSKKQINTLLRWRGGLSRSQVKAILEVWGTCLPERRPLTYWCCCCG